MKFDAKQLLLHSVSMRLPSDWPDFGRSHSWTWKRETSGKQLINWWTIQFWRAVPKNLFAMSRAEHHCASLIIARLLAANQWKSKASNANSLIRFRIYIHISFSPTRRFSIINLFHGLSFDFACKIDFGVHETSLRALVDERERKIIQFMDN